MLCVYPLDEYTVTLNLNQTLKTRINFCRGVLPSAKKSLIHVNLNNS